jgi:hypothetical protein
VVGEQHAELVAAQDPPAAGHARVGYRHRTPVGVGVVGDGEVGTVRPGQRGDPVHGSRLLRIGKRHSGKVRIRYRLIRDDQRRVESGRRHRVAEHPPADAVHRRVRDHQPRGR